MTREKWSLLGPNHSLNIGTTYQRSYQKYEIIPCFHEKAFNCNPEKIMHFTPINELLLCWINIDDFKKILETETIYYKIIIPKKSRLDFE